MDGAKRQLGYFFAVVMLPSCLSIAALAQEATTASATLLAPADSVELISSVATLPIFSLPVKAGMPVVKATVLIETDKKRLQKELRGVEGELDEVQEKKRFLASNKEVRRGGGSTQFSGPDVSMETDLALREADLMRDLIDVQTKLSTADIRAPRDGYVVEHFVASGSQAKKRKPALSFIGADQTLVQVSVSGKGYLAGDTVVVTSADSLRHFRARVLKVSDAPSGQALVLQPVELPFLSLESPAEVVVAKAKL